MDPCGVEASPRRPSSSARPGFRWTLVGSKLSERVYQKSKPTCFRWTLVGSKQEYAMSLTEREDPFQMDPCGVEARPVRPPETDCAVSDGPLWGRSRWEYGCVCYRRGFQMDPCGVEAGEAPSRGRPRRVSDGPLWGRSRSRNTSPPRTPAFQMDPCGVEARAATGPTLVSGWVSDGPLWGRSYLDSETWAEWAEFQMDPCGVEAVTSPVDDHVQLGFRWTLVGSKLLRGSPNRSTRLVSDGPLWGRSPSESPVGRTQIESFQMDPCGVEAGTTTGVGKLNGSFRWTLVGSKLEPAARSGGGGGVSDGPLWGRSGRRSRRGDPRARFQMDPCGVEATARRSSTTASPVSDGPLWGRSNDQAGELEEFLRVSDGPLWGRSSPLITILKGRLSFRWTLVGSKLDDVLVAEFARDRFRWTLVGSKRGGPTAVR